MQALVAKEKEPITPFLAKIGALRERGVSCILVMGGSGDYFGVSDAVVCMDNYGCRDVTAEALAIYKRFGASAAAQGSSAAYGSVTPRCPISIYPGSPAGQPCQAPCPWHDLMQLFICKQNYKAAFEVSGSELPWCSPEMACALSSRLKANILFAWSTAILQRRKCDSAAVHACREGQMYSAADRPHTVWR